MDDTLTVVLDTAIVFAKTDYEKLDLSEPTAKQLITASKAGNELEQAAMLIHLNAKVPMGVVEQLPQRKFEEAALFFDRFYLRPPTSASASPASAASTAGAPPTGSA